MQVFKIAFFYGLLFSIFVLELNWKVMMKSIIKSLLTLAAVSSVFLIGFYLGQEKVVSMIPDFQKDTEETP